MTDPSLNIVKIQQYMTSIQRHLAQEDWLMISILAHEINYESAVICGKATIKHQIEKAGRNGVEQ